MLITTRAPPRKQRGLGQTFSGPAAQIGDYEFKAALTIDQPDAMPNGFGQECHPVGGTLVISTPNGTSGTFVISRGSNCAVGASTALSMITATFIIDATRSTGGYANTTGVGAFSWSADASSSPHAVILSFSDNLHF